MTIGVLVHPGIGLERQAAFISRDPADQLGAVVGHLGPHVLPVEVEADGEADAAEIGVEDARRGARHDAVVDLALGRPLLGIDADEPAGAVDQRRDVGDAAVHLGVEAGDHVHGVLACALGDGAEGRAVERLGDLGDLHGGKAGGDEALGEKGEIGALGSRRVEQRQAELPRIGGIGIAEIEGRRGVLERRQRRGGDLGDTSHG